MPRNGSGGYSPPQNSWNPAINGMGALPNDWMAILNDMAAAIQASIAADGQTPITGSLNFGNNRLRNVGAPQGQGDGLRLEQIMKGADIPSATTIAFPIEGAFFEVTGTTTITGIAPAFPGRSVLVRFADVLTLTNGTNLELPGGVNVTTKAGDFAAFSCVDGTKWVCWLYPRLTQDQIDQNTARFQTFAQIGALTSDQGPIICIDQGGAVYVWDGAAYAPLLGDETYAGALNIATTVEAQALTDDTRAITPKKLGDALDATALGWDQTWQDVTASRAASTTYTNTTGRPIIVRVTCNNTTTSFNASLFVDGVSVDDVTFSYGSGSITSRSTLIAIVPPGETYSFEYTGGSWTRWMELR